MQTGTTARPEPKTFFHAIFCVPSDTQPPEPPKGTYTLSVRFRLTQVSSCASNIFPPPGEEHRIIVCEDQGALLEYVAASQLTTAHPNLLSYKLTGPNGETLNAYVKD